MTFTSPSFRFLAFIPFKKQQQERRSSRENSSSSLRSSNASKSSDSQNKPACIAIIIGKDGVPVTKCITPALRKRLDGTSLDPVKKQRRLSTLLLHTKFRSRSSSAKVVPFHNRFHQLPSELFIQIAAYLDLASVLCLSRVSRYCYQMCGRYNNYLWHKLYLQQLGPIELRQELSYFAAYRDQYQLMMRWQQGQAKSHYLTGHDDSVYCLVWVNSHQIISGSRDRSIKLWDIAENRCLVTRRHHQGSVLCLAMDPHGKFFISGSSDATLIYWSLPDLVPQKRMEGHMNGVLDVCLVQQWVVSSSRDTTVRVWDLQGRQLHRLLGHNGPVNALEHVQGTGQVITASGDATLKLWDVQTGQCLRTFVGHQRGLACLRYDPHHQYIISGGQDGKIKVWDIKTADCLHTMTGHSDLIRTIDTYKGTVVSGSYDRTLRVWNASTGDCLLSFHSVHSSWIFNVLISQTKIISAGQDKKIMILDFGHGLGTILT
ncbi:WD40 repeat-like protein [Hesseltinella vesiculosa]|uniref:WD40 repeat-like protein n=1 Tax=Hesseltinella vesiculosa TaxID=101127 RepID=A0A1X2GNM2_9FUNG|nr:WD40 repeat-like protein [Hesseltinella vesiculosa]